VSRQVSSELFRFELPSELEPEDDWCVKVHIPAHSDYLAILMSHLKALTFSRNFARDDTREGASLVSHRWEQALFNEPLIVGCGEDDMTTIRLRVKPGVPWISQFSYDEGVTWVDFLIQPNWSSVQDTMTIADGDAPADLLAQQIFKFFISIVTQITDGIDAGDPENSTIQHVTDSLSQWAAGATIAPTIQEIYDAIEADPTSAAELLDECAWLDPFATLKSAIEGAGSLLALRLTQALDNLQSTTASDIARPIYGLAKLLGAASLRDISEASNPNASGYPFGIACFGEFTNTGVNYRLYGPWEFDLHVQNSSYAVKYLFFNKPAGWKICGEYIENSNNEGAYSSAVGMNGFEGESSFPGYTSMGYPGQVMGNGVGSGLKRGARWNNALPMDFWTSAGLPDPDDNYQPGGLGTDAAVPLGTFDVTYNVAHTPYDETPHFKLWMALVEA
jgi:hypothetical protein